MPDSIEKKKASGTDHQQNLALFRALPDSVAEPMFIAEVTATGQFRLTDASPAWLDMMRITTWASGGTFPEAVKDHPGVRELLGHLHRTLQGRDWISLPEGMPFALGRRQLHISLMPVLDADGNLLRIVGRISDVSSPQTAKAGQRQLDRELMMLSECNQAMMRARDEQALLSDICRIICELAGYRMAWVGYPDGEDQKLISLIAWAGEEKGDFADADIFRLEQNGLDPGPSVCAVRNGATTIVQNLQAEARAGSWRGVAVSCGYHSAIALPLKDTLGRPFGALTIYAGNSEAFMPEESLLLEKLSSDLAFGITVLRARLEQKRAEAERLSNLHFFESMDKVNRAIQRASDLEQMMIDVLDAVLKVFGCDRAYLLHPCDPDAPTWKVPMERTRPSYPGVLALGLEMEMTPQVSNTFRLLLESDGPVQFGPGTPYAVPPDVAERFQLKSFMSMALYPKMGMPWQFGIHQCSSVRNWSPNEERIMHEIGLRLADGLTSMLSFRAHMESEGKLKEAERQFHTLVDNLPDCIARFDREGRAVYVNQTAEKSFGFPTKDVVGTHLAETGAGDGSLNITLSALVERAFQEGVANSLETEWETLHGRRHFDIRHVPERDEEGRVISVLGIAHDITDRKYTEEALRRSEERYRRIVDTASEGILMMDDELLISFVNARMAEMLGCQVEDMIGTPLLDFLFKEDKPGFQQCHAAMGQGSQTSQEQRFRCWDGGALWTLTSASPISDGEEGFRGTITLVTDITERKRQQEQLIYQAHFDPLTDLPNRLLAMDRLEQNIRVAARNGSSTALLFLDLDDFKKVNDALGHEVGDQALKLASARLRQAVRSSDTVARLGGDEFIILIHEIADADAVRPVAEKIVQAFQEVFPVMGREVMLTASLGISIYPDDGNEPLVLLRNADTAMYHAKAKGRNAYQFFTESMNLDVARRLQMEEQMRLALGRNEFRLEYQPIVEVSSGTIVGVEALLRWRNPVLGDVPTPDFIEVAEQTGLIIDLGEWVIETALGDLQDWGPWCVSGFRLALNVSPRQFRQAGFVAGLQRAMKKTGIRGEQLELEITEGILLGGEVGAAEVIAQLRDLGVKVSMDDFGTGYSSLSYLRNYRFDTLKIDRVFIRDIIDDPNDRELIIATLRMARGLGVRVVAEGVETAEQFAFLRHERCDCAQGFFLGRPLQASEIAGYLERNERLGVAG